MPRGRTPRSFTCRGSRTRSPWSMAFPPAIRSSSSPSVWKPSDARSKSSWSTARRSLAPRSRRGASPTAATRSLGPAAFGRRRSTEPLTPSLPDGLDLVGAPERDHPEIEDGERPQRQAGKRVVTGWERSETEAPHEAFDKGAVSPHAPEGQVGDQGLLSGSVERLELEAPVDLVDRHVVVARVRG